MNWKTLGIKNWDKVIISQIYIKSTRNKFKLLPVKIKYNAEILLITGTKISQIFFYFKFPFQGYSESFRFDGIEHGGNRLIFIRLFEHLQLSG